VRLRRVLERPTPERMLILAYYGAMDDAGHLYGVGAPEQRAEVAAIDHALRRELFEPLRRRDTLFLLVADHGQLNSAPERTIELADHPDLLRDVAAVAGEARSRYLHVRPGRQAAVLECLAERFGEMSTVVESREAFEAGLFGPAAAPILTDNVPAVAARAG